MNPTTIYSDGLSVTWPKEWCQNQYVKEPPRICLDLDGVVCEYDFPRMIKEDFGIDIRTEDIYTYDIDDILGVTKEAVKAMFKKRVYDPARCEPDARDTMEEWIERGYKILVYSSRSSLMGSVTLELWIDENHIPCTHLTTGQGEYDIHIDDRPSKLAATDSRHKLLYNRPWNRGCWDIKHQFRRVYDWKEIKERVHALLEEE